MKSFRVYLAAFYLLHIYCASAQTQTTASTFADGYVANQGQLLNQHHQPCPQVKYIFHSSGLNVQLRDNGFSYDTYTIEEKLPGKRHRDDSIFHKKIKTTDAEVVYHFHRVDIIFKGANENPVLQPGNPLTTRNNYFTSRMPEQGVTLVRSYSQITYRNLYDGIDLEFSINGTQPEFSFVVHPGADASQIRWTYAGADDVSQTGEQIILNLGQAVLAEKIPKSFLQETAKPVNVSYRKSEGGEFCFSVPSYNKKQTLVIDPVPNRIWGTFLGGTGGESGSGLCVDAAGNIYVAGGTSSISNIATNGSFQNAFGGGVFAGDAFVAKFNPSGKKMWATYLGGDKDDYALSIALDASGNIYITGQTGSSSAISTAGAFQPVFGGGISYGDAFIIKLNNDGVRQWGTYFGGNDAELGYKIITDHSGNVLVAGSIHSYDTLLMSPGAHQTIFGGGWDGFLCKFSNSGGRLWATYYGGDKDDFANSLAVDSVDNIFMAGQSVSLINMATPGSYQPLNGGISDALLVKFDPDGVRQWATFYGGEDYDNCTEISMMPNGHIYLTGWTYSTTKIATPGAMQTTQSGDIDAFVARFTYEGALVWGSYIGGAGREFGTCITTDQYENVFFSGSTASSGLFSGNTLFQQNKADSTDIYLYKFDPSGNMQWGTYIGGNGQDYCNSICTIDELPWIYLTGNTSSKTLFSVSGAEQPFYGGGLSDAYIAAFDKGCAQGPEIVPQTVKPFCDGDSALLRCNNISWNTYKWLLNNNTGNFAADSLLTVKTAGLYRLVSSKINGCVDTSEAVSVVVNPKPDTTIVRTGNPVLCQGNVFSMQALPWGGIAYQWKKDGVKLNGDTTGIYKAGISGNYQLVFSNVFGCTDSSAEIEVLVNLLPVVKVTTADDTIVCEGRTVLLRADTGAQLNYQWIKTGLPLAADTASILPVRGSGKYAVMVTDSLGCTDTSNVIGVTVNPKPDAGILPDSVVQVCEGDPVKLIAEAGGNLVYAWLRNDTLIAGADKATHLVQTGGSYSLIAGNDFGCYDTSEITQVIVNRNPVLGEVFGPQKVNLADTSVYFVTYQPGLIYKWKVLNGTILSGQGSEQIAVLWKGMYYGAVQVKATTAQQCVRTGMQPVLVKSVFDADMFVVFPNPASDHITVRSSKSLYDVKIEVTDLLGRRVMDGFIPTTTEEFSFRVDHLAASVYVLELRRGAVTWRKKFVKE